MTQAIPVTLSLPSTIVQKISELTPQQQQSVLDFIEFLQSRAQPQSQSLPEENSTPVESPVSNKSEPLTAEANPEKPPISAYDLAKQWAGCVDSGIGDLSYNKKYLEGPLVK